MPSKEPVLLSSVGFFEIFKFASKKDKVMMFFAAIFSSIQGLMLPGMMLIFGNFTENMTGAIDPVQGQANITDQTLIMVFLGIVVFVSSTIALVLWVIAGKNQMTNLRDQYFRHILMKNASWYDHEKPGKLASAYFHHLSMLTQVYGNKLHVLFQLVASFFSGFGVGFYKGWSMCLLIITISPLMILGMMLFMLYIRKSAKIEQDAYAEAGSVSDQAFEYIRTVKSLKGENHEAEKYLASLGGVTRATHKFSFKLNFCYGFLFFSMNFQYALSFLIGNIVLNNKWFNHNSQSVYSVGDYVAIFFAIASSMGGISMIGPIQKSIAEAKVAIARINKIVNRENLDPSGNLRPDKDAIKGEIRFENVTFAYPTQPDQPVLRNVSFTVSPGEKFAIVGPSGSGKSTIIQLLERFYDPQEGRILLDGIDIRDIQVAHYRTIMGLVFQQPVLFADTVKNNLVIGMEQQGLLFNEEKIWESLARANVKEFIEKKLENGLETYVGNLGSQFSGGQKQRISIARVLLRNPRVFLFDEATSALDRQNEKEIQETIDQVCSEVTSVSIAHRLQTIKNSDKIIVLSEGQIVESGSHDRLMEIEEGIYRDLYNKQNLGQEEGEESGAQDQPVQPEEKVAPKNKLEILSANQVETQIDNSDKINDSKNKNKDEKDKEKDKEEKNEKVKPKGPVHLLTSSDYLSKQNKLFIVLGVICSALAGGVMPFLGFFFGKVLAVFGKYDIINKDPSREAEFPRDTLWHEGMLYFYVMTAMSVGAFLCTSTQYYFFTKVSSDFLVKVRSALFRKFIYKDIEYFDQPENKPGSLSSKLSNDCSLIKRLVSSYFGAILQSVGSFLLGLGLGFYFSWRITLLVIALSPLMLIGSFVQSAVYMRQGKRKTGEDENIVQETFNNIKLVKSLVAEHSIHLKYLGGLKASHKRLFKQELCLSIVLGVSQFSQFGIFALIFYAAGVWRTKHNLNMGDMFTAIFSLIFGVMGIGMANQILGDVGQAKKAMNNIFDYINEMPRLEYNPKDPIYARARSLQSKDKRIQEKVNQIKEDQRLKEARKTPELKGNIEFKNVWFKFPTRNTFTLKGLNLTLQAKSNCAIVGASGSGKSTIFQLLMRFYDPDQGEILIDGHDIRSIDMGHLRSFFGLIKQEPEIFNGNIEYNIAYNCQGRSREDVQKVCQTSNCQEFIDMHHEGLERDTGNRGDALSGGQKQRLAIARVLLKDPKVFLFDEATSALDSKSEEVVQKAIEKIWGLHSSLSIAHRYSTIKKCDQIFVIENGKVAEIGTYDELMLKQGIFYGLAID